MDVLALFCERVAVPAAGFLFQHFMSHVSGADIDLIPFPSSTASDLGN